MVKTEIFDCILTDLADNPPLSWGSVNKVNFQLIESKEHPSCYTGVAQLNRNAFCDSAVPRKILIKVAKEGVAENLEREVGLLSDADKDITIAGVSVPKVCRFYPSLKAFAMEFCPGYSLSRCLTYASFFEWPERSKRKWSDLTQRIAIWLAQYHQMGEATLAHQQLKINEVESLKRKFTSLRRLGKYSGAFSSVLESLEEKYCHVGALGDTAANIGLIHGDFGLHNMLCEDKQIYVLDLGGSRTGFLLEDISRFFMELDVLFHARFVRIRPSFFLKLRETFKMGYGCEFAPLVERFFYVKVHLMLLFTLECLSAKREFRQWWHSRIKAHLINNLTLMKNS